MDTPRARSDERIVGHGVDLVEVDRFGRLLDRHGDHALARLFTEAERAYAAAHPNRAAEHLAARFAAKEAALKALGTGWSGGIAWTDVEVVHAAATETDRDTQAPPDVSPVTGSGPPGLVLAGLAAEIADDLGVARWLLSLTHVRGLAMASAIAVGPARSA